MLGVMIEAEHNAPPRKRRWYQFSLRTVMIVVTLFCVVGGWFGSEVYRTQHRKQVRIAFESRGGMYFHQERHPKPFPLPLFRDFLGDIPYERITFDKDSPLTAADEAVLRETFPEADLGHEPD